MFIVLVGFIAKSCKILSFLEILEGSILKLRKCEKVENVLSIWNKVIKGEFGPNFNVVPCFSLETLIIGTQSKNILVIQPRTHIKLWIVVSSHIKEYFVENNISVKHHCSVLLSWPPRPIAVEWLLVFIIHVIIICEAISQSSRLTELLVVVGQIFSLNRKFKAWVGIWIDAYVNRNSKGTSIGIFDNNSVILIDLSGLEPEIIFSWLSVASAYKKVSIPIECAEGKNNLW